MSIPTLTNHALPGEPVFGFVLMGGAVSGALVRDVRLANALSDRGYRVYVWWAMDRSRSVQLNPEIKQQWLFHGTRFLGRHGREIKDGFGRLLNARFDDLKRSHFAQKRPIVVRHLLQGMIREVCDGVERDQSLIRRFADELAAAGVTHLLPTLELLCSWAAAAAPLVGPSMRYVVTFQGYELYANYARAMNCEDQLYARLAEVVAGSAWPAIAVSPQYRDRIVEDIGVPAGKIAAIPPGVPMSQPVDRERMRDYVAAYFPAYRPQTPLITYLGRRDTEKGIDLLLYAARILRERGLDFQIAVCGPTAFGGEYEIVCRQIAENLRCPVLWQSWIPDELRTALFAASRAVVYPSIHGEPFGMVPVEALALGTPAIVPDHGGVSGAIRSDRDEGGLTFRAWDSGDLAHRIEQLLVDDLLWNRLSAAGPRVAQYYSIDAMTDRVLNHLDLAPRPASQSAAPSSAGSWVAA